MAFTPHGRLISHLTYARLFGLPAVRHAVLLLEGREPAAEGIHRGACVCDVQYVCAPLRTWHSVDMWLYV
jgi:hypothetical protein